MAEQRSSQKGVGWGWGVKSIIFIWSVTDHEIRTLGDLLVVLGFLTSCRLAWSSHGTIRCSFSELIRAFETKVAMLFWRGPGVGVLNQRGAREKMN